MCRCHIEQFASERHLSVGSMFLRTKTEQRVLRLVCNRGDDSEGREYMRKSFKV